MNLEGLIVLIVVVIIILILLKVLLHLFMVAPFGYEHEIVTLQTALNAMRPS